MQLIVFKYNITIELILVNNFYRANFYVQQKYLWISLRRNEKIFCACFHVFLVQHLILLLLGVLEINSLSFLKNTFRIWNKNKHKLVVVMSISYNYYKTLSRITLFTTNKYTKEVFCFQFTKGNFILISRNTTFSYTLICLIL